MSIETTLYAAINNDAATTALVGDRIYPIIAPDNAATPYITYQVISTEAHNILDGAPGSERKVIQINCFSNTYANAKAISARLLFTAGRINGRAGIVSVPNS